MGAPPGVNDADDEPNLSKGTFGPEACAVGAADTAHLPNAPVKGVALCESIHRNAKKREDSMNLQQRCFVLVVILVSTAATPAFGQAVAPTVGPAYGGSESAESIPDF